MTEILMVGFSVVSLIAALFSLYCSSKIKVDESFKDKLVIRLIINKKDDEKILSLKSWAEKEGIDFIDKR
jgi:hypothetical protein